MKTAMTTQELTKVLAGRETPIHWDAAAVPYKEVLNTISAAGWQGYKTNTFADSSVYFFIPEKVEEVVSERKFMCPNCDHEYSTIPQKDGFGETVECPECGEIDEVED